MQDLFLERTPLGEHLEQFGFVGTGVVSSRPADSTSAPFVQAPACNHLLASRTGTKPRDQPSGHVEKYRSRDHATGRVWGMPSAFGKSQCLDCPAKALPPHMRCEACQVTEQSRSHPPMSEENVRRLRDALQELRFGPAWDAWSQVDELCTLLQGGRIAEPVQTKLCEVAKALSEQRPADADALLSSLAGEDWQQRKKWLRALQRLVRNVKS